MISLKPLILVENLPLLIFLFIVFLSQITSASKSHLEHHKYRYSSPDSPKNKYIIKFSTSHDSDLSDTFLNSFCQDFINVNIKILYNYKSPIFHGLAFRIDAPNTVYSDIMNAMMDHPHVESMHQQNNMKSLSTKFGKSGIDLAIDPTDFINPHHMTQVKRVHDELQNRGEGVFIGVIDTGIDYNHPALGGGFGKGYKVAAGYDLVGDHYDPNGEEDPVEDNDPFDSCPEVSKGHGTHVSGIIGGYDPSRNFTGVAPGATLGMWRVSSCLSPDIPDPIILAALIRAYEAGVDIINISLGGPISWSTSIVSTVVNRIIDEGIVVVISAGNTGEDPMYTLTSPGISEHSITVASVENDYFYGPNLKASGIDYFIPYVIAHGSTNHFPYNSIPMEVQYYHDHPDSTPHFCVEKNIYFSHDNIKDSLVITPYPNECFKALSNIIKEKGALGVITVSEYNSISDSNFMFDSTITILSVTKDYGSRLFEKYKETGNVRIKLRNPQSKSYLNRNQAGGTMLKTSSVGPSAELLLKPELGAIGGSVLSTVPLKLGGWETHSGTSMAAPYISGSIALYLAAHGRKSKENPLLIKEKFMNYAKPLQVYQNQALDSPLRQGAGLVQAYDAITQTTLVSPSKISFNDTAIDLYKTQVLTVYNWGSDEVTYNMHNNVSVSLTSFDESNNASYYSAPNITEQSAAIAFSADTITVPSQKSVNVTVTVDLSDPSLSSFVYYGGFIQFKSNSDEHKDINVPYFGVNGRQKDLPIFSPVLPPFLNDTATRTTFMNTEKQAFKFDTYGNSTIEINFSLVTPTGFLKCEMLDAHDHVRGYIPLVPNWDNSKPKNTVNLYRMNRNNNAQLYYTADVNSRYVPPEFLVDNILFSKIRYQGLGRYRLSALKLFGDPEIEEDWEVWNSGPVNFV